MRVTNRTRISTETLRIIVRFVQPSNVTNFSITFGNTKGGISGVAYPSRKRGRVHISVPLWISAGTRYIKPHDSWTPKGKGYLPYRTYTPTETLLGVIAHELRHLWQAKVPKGWRVWGARGQFSERDADAYAIRKLREWRRNSR